MLRLAILAARGRLGTFIGAFIALAAASVLAMASGMQLESMLRTHPPVERYAAAGAVVIGHQNVGPDHDVPLTERARVSSALVARLSHTAGVRAAIGDMSVPARLGDRTAVAHGWSSAALTPYVLSAGRPPTGPDEVVTGYPAALGAWLRLASTAATQSVTVVGVARPRHAVSQQSAIFLTDAQAVQLAGHPGRVDAIGLLAAPGFDISRVRAAASGAEVLTGAARGRAEYPGLQNTRTTLIPVTAAFGGLALFIAMFVVSSTLGLSIQQREREIALLRAVAATPRQIRRMLAWEAAIVALIGSAVGIWPGVLLGRTLARALVRHGIAPSNFALHTDWLPAAAVVGCAVVTSLLAVLAAGRRAARVPPTHALAGAALEPRLLGPGRIIGGLLVGSIFVRADQPRAVAQRLRELGRRYPGLRVSDRTSFATATDADREMNRWFGPQFVAEIFAFTSIAVVNTLIMIALGRRRELGLLQLVGATRRQVRSMARWEAGLIIAIGLGIGLAIAAIALLPLSRALNGGLPYVPGRPFAAILGRSALLAVLAMALPTRRALRARPVEAIGASE